MVTPNTPSRIGISIHTYIGTYGNAYATQRNAWPTCTQADGHRRYTTLLAVGNWPLTR